MEETRDPTVPGPTVLDVAHREARRWLDSLDERRIPPTASVEEVVARLGSLPEWPADPVDAVTHLVEACAPGLTAGPSGRFFGFVTGGVLPASLAADWLTSAWDQNALLRTVTPAHSAVEDVASSWVLELLGLPSGSAVGFVTGATMANFTALAAAREHVLRTAGWDVARDGLAGSPGVRVLVGRERHDTIDVALRYLGLGAPTPVAADDQGRIDPAALAEALDGPAPTIVVLQAGNVHSGAFDPFPEAVAVAREHGAWVHVDGAFGLWAAATPAYRHLTEGVDGADSWATDAHKTLNVPYDCGLAIVRDPATVRAAMGMHGDYLVRSDAGEPFEKVPETSRRARAIPVWAALRSLGRTGIAELVDRLCRHATTFADAVRDIPGATVLNDVVFTQVCATFGDDDRTRAVVQGMLEDGTAWTTGSRWRDQAVLRISVSNWATDDRDVARTIEALRRVVAAL
jgi:glutamate/tyrosine decarboxylase-like PLP-dependent enzyme